MAARRSSSNAFAGPGVRRRGDRFDVPSRPKAIGSYPTKGDGLGEFGGTAYPGLLEAYARESDQGRWRAGVELYYGVGDSWSASQLLSVARLAAGAGGSEIPLVTTLFASKGSAEKAWHVTTKVRGSVLLPVPITAERVRLVRIDPDPTKHRVVLDATGILGRTELRAFRTLIGDQFEDSAIGPTYPLDLMQTPMDAVALTLVDVDVAARQLIFDLSRPIGRVWRGGRLYWQPLEYDPVTPISWRTAGDRHLTNSATFDCSCPDYQGRLYGDDIDADASSGRKTPATSSGRQTETAWEQQGAGYFKQWRTLDDRRDRRRQCKHIHAVRWGFGVPFDEPSDYPLGGDRSWGGGGGAPNHDLVAAFESKRLLGYDRWLSGAARAIGFVMDPPGDLRSGDRGFRPDAQPVLWDDATEPEYARCRLNDWWLQRGTETVKIFSPADGGFQELIRGKPVFEQVAQGDTAAPVIVI